MPLKHYKDLGSTFRNDPCIEYPGSWLLYVDGVEQPSYNSLEDAMIAYNKFFHETVSKITVCWKASDNDPRIGEIWFTGFYQRYP